MYYKMPDKNILYCDVDDTLVIWNPPIAGNNIDGDYLVIDDEVLQVHKKHIEMLKQFKARGLSVVIWSQGGSDWAEKVVKALKIESYVDLIVPKPTWFADDLPSNLWMPEANRIYKDNITKTKKIEAINTRD